MTVASSMYPGTGTKDGVLRDRVLIAPAYNGASGEIEEIVSAYEMQYIKLLINSSLSTSHFIERLVF